MRIIHPIGSSAQNLCCEKKHKIRAVSVQAISLFTEAPMEPFAEKVIRKFQLSQFKPGAA
jgi:hypothetical protein